MGTDHRFLHAFGFVYQHRVRRNFRSAARGRRNAWQPHGTPAQIANAEGFAHWLLSVEQGATELRRIDRAAAPASNDAIGKKCPCCGRYFFEKSDLRLTV